MSDGLITESAIDFEAANLEIEDYANVEEMSKNTYTSSCSSSSTSSCTSCCA
ncbi:thiazolylpeptide-type bacteriocin [Kocuria massiliensis]|uniref:thiazolylpeptide-type bacteriocin n=1 Tax=Kocuria massiliensis TaxID=1926282 RepID=UPI0022B95072|nr:thiazolylpeptide-type bacteriocin [Kocuria massiliensis]